MSQTGIVPLDPPIQRDWQRTGAAARSVKHRLQRCVNSLDGELKLQSPCNGRMNLTVSAEFKQCDIPGRRTHSHTAQTDVLSWKRCIKGTHNERRSLMRVATVDRVCPFSGPVITPFLAKRGRIGKGAYGGVQALRQDCGYKIAAG